MPLIDQQEAIKKIRNNREYLADTDYIRGLNAGIEYSVDAVEQMKGQEIIHCEECVYKKICSWKNQGAEFCSFGERGDSE